MCDQITHTSRCQIESQHTYIRKFGPGIHLGQVFYQAIEAAIHYCHQLAAFFSLASSVLKCCRSLSDNYP